MTALIWAAVKPWLKSLNLWALVALLGLIVAIYFGSIIRDQRKEAKAKADAITANATATVKAATTTVVEERKAIEDTPLTSERAALIEACKREASCRSRGKL